MPTVELLDGPVEWAGAVLESPEDMVADEIGLTHPRWRGTLLGHRTLYAYGRVEIVGDRHRYRYQGPYGARRHRHAGGIEDRTGWEVLVAQTELESGDRRRLWAARCGSMPPHLAPPARSWSVARGAGLAGAGPGGWLGRHHPGQAAYLQEAMAQRMAEGDRWVVEQWRRLAATGGAAKDAEAARILDEHLQLLKLAEAARMLRRLRPDVVVSWTSAPPFLGRRTYIPVIGAALAAIAVLGARSGVAMQDRAVLVVHPELGEDVPVFGSASVYGAPPDASPPDRSRAPEGRAGLGWQRGTSWSPGCCTSHGGRSPTASRPPPSSTDP